MESATIDFSRLCRTCKNESTDMRFLHAQDTDSYKDDPRIDYMLMSCTNLKIEETDGLPHLICRYCVNQVKIAFNFQKLCKKTDQFYRDVLSIDSNRNQHSLESYEMMISELNKPSGHKDLAEEKHRNDNSDFIEFLDNDIIILTCKTCYKIFTTLDGLKSHRADHIRMCNKRGSRDIHQEIPEKLPKLENLDNIQDDYDEANIDIKSLVSDDKDALLEITSTKIYAEGDSQEIIEEKIKIEKEEEIDKDNIQINESESYDSNNSEVSEYLPKKKSEKSHRHQIKRVKDRPTKLNKKRKDAELYQTDLDSKRAFSELPRVQKEISKHECKVCKKRFTRVSTLKRHLLLHAETKVFAACHICSKTFLRLDHLQTHLKLHAPKKYTCSLCEQRFARKYDLLVHLRRHRGDKPYECKICRKGFPCNTDLKRHERQHTREKKHICNVCGQSFERAYTLRAHKRIHAGERFQCDLCEKSYLANHLLLNHKKSFHGLKNA